MSNPFWALIPIALASSFYIYLLRQACNPIISQKINPQHSVWVYLLFLGIGMIDSFCHSPSRFSETQLKSFKAAVGEVNNINAYADGDVLEVVVSNLYQENLNIVKVSNFKIRVKTDGYSAKIGDILLFPISLQ
ncbi:MAG: hypothetical protein K2K58_10315, partial [Muribaculaceae bacterium]|nr:hypothetical protein [Muribaculaceae bacterium]